MAASGKVLLCLCVLQNAPLVRKAIVVAPATLVKNWGKEVSKWLGSERLKVMILSQVSCPDHILADRNMCG